jgi:hypothetical protein
LLFAVSGYREDQPTPSAAMRHKKRPRMRPFDAP